MKVKPDPSKPYRGPAYRGLTSSLEMPCVFCGENLPKKPDRLPDFPEFEDCTCEEAKQAAAQNLRKIQRGRSSSRSRAEIEIELDQSLRRLERREAEGASEDELDLIELTLDMLEEELEGAW